MCYNAASLTQASLKYAKHRGESAEEIAIIEEKLNRERTLLSPHFFINAFAHPPLLTFTNTEPKNPQLLSWGLIPFWAKDEITAHTIANQTINARSETMFEKPSFRNAAKNKRCLIFLDAFYEYHHLKNKTYPFLIAMKNGNPMVVAGLWEEWTNPQTGELIRTVSIVTTKGNETMAKIHNNPKNAGPRMPVILLQENMQEWLEEKEVNNNLFKSILEPLPDEFLTYQPVRKLTGKEGSGNTPEAMEPFKYIELEEM